MEGSIIAEKGGDRKENSMLRDIVEAKKKKKKKKKENKEKKERCDSKKRSSVKVEMNIRILQVS